MSRRHALQVDLLIAEALESMPSPDSENASPQKSLATALRSSGIPLAAVLGFAIGYITGNSYSLVDISAGNIKVSTKPVDSVEMTLQKFIKDDQARPILEEFIVTQIKNSTYSKGLGKEIVHLAKDSEHPFAWGFTDDVKLVYNSKIPPSFFEVCRDSPLLNKEVVIAVFDNKGNPTDSADRGSAGWQFLKLETCDPRKVYTSNAKLVSASQAKGFNARARELITLPISGR